jgi:hypothetical protein
VRKSLDGKRKESKMMNHKHFAQLLGMVVGGTLLLLSVSASAGNTRYPWAACYTSPGDTHVVQHTSTAGPINDSTTVAADLYCPIVTGDAVGYDSHEISSVKAYVADGSTVAAVVVDLIAQESDDRYNWDTCGSASSSGTGEKTLTVTNSSCTSSTYSSWSMMLRVTLPAKYPTHWNSTLNMYEVVD